MKDKLLAFINPEHYGIVSEEAAAWSAFTQSTATTSAIIMLSISASTICTWQLSPQLNHSLQIRAPSYLS
jgi:hypothetical protein